MDVSPESTFRLVLECATAAFTAVAALFGFLNHRTGADNKATLNNNTAKIDTIKAAVSANPIKE